MNDADYIPKWTAKSWTHFLDLVDKAQRELSSETPGVTEFWYRGHERASHTLTPSLFRYRDPEGKRDSEANQEYLFALYARALLGDPGCEMGTWERLFDMQHYGIPTRLLDWTQVLGVAVFFAVRPNNQDRPSVFVLNPVALNRKNHLTEVLRVPDASVVYHK
jgi:hypothetical protein